MEFKQISILLTKVFILLIPYLLISLPTINAAGSCSSTGMNYHALDTANKWSYKGTAESYYYGDYVSIAEEDGSGAIWHQNKVIFQPKFELGVRIEMDTPVYGCTTSFDGFAIILSDSIKSVGSGGDGKGYGGLFNVLVSEFDFYYNQGDIDTNSFSMHRCYDKYCESQEDTSTSQVILPFKYDKCKTLTLDIKLIYTNGSVKIFNSDSLIFESK